MRTLLTALTALMLFVTPLVAGDLEDGIAAYEVGNYQNAYSLLKPLAERGNASAQAVIGWMYRAGKGVHWWRTSARPRI